MEKEIDFSFFKTGDHLTDDQAMGLAINKAYGGAPYVSPNPLVGCVILNAENKLLSTGFHEKYGESHAEINAIKKLSTSDLLNSKIFITLEPCAHEGKTGSCAKKIAEISKTIKIKKVIYGLQDPNPLVAGQGAEILREAGIVTEEYQGHLKNDLEDLAEIFLKNFREKKTFVSMKAASSLDGQIAINQTLSQTLTQTLNSDESKWITGSESREYVHELRSWYDATLVGRKTIEMDDPSLNIRHSKIKKENKLIILDPSGKILKNISEGKKYKFLEVNKIENIFFAITSSSTDNKLKQDSIIQNKFQIIPFSDLNNLMNEVWNLKIKSLFIEGGAATYSSFLNAGLVDRLHLFMNTSIIGSKTGLSWTSGFGVSSLSEKLQLRNTKSRIFGSDIYVTGKLG